MNSQMERIRDALAGAVLGGIATIVIFLLSLIISAIRKAAGSSFSVMPGTVLIGIAISTICLSFIAGLVFGIYLTRPSAMVSNARRWMARHNK